MKKHIQRLTCILIMFLCGTVIPVEAAEYTGLTLVEGPFYIHNGHNQNEYLYASGEWVYGNGNYTPQNGTDDGYMWNIWTDGSYYYLENVGTGLFMNTQTWGDSFEMYGAYHNSLNAKTWTGSGTRFYAFTLPDYTTGNRIVGETVTTKIFEQRAEWGNRPLHNGYDTGNFNASSTTNKVYFTSNDFGWGTENWVFVKTAQTPATPPTAINVSVARESIGVGSTTEAVAVVSPNEASSSVTWTSSNPSVATVDANGKITAVSAGTFTVTATSTVEGSVSGTSATVTVTAPMAQVCNNSFGIAQIEDESPLIDNLIEDVWATTPKNAINQVLNGGGNPSNAGNWRALYDGDNLYLLVEVSDPSKQGNAGWNGDAVEIYIDGNGNGGNNSYADADDAAIKFSFSGNSVGSTGMAYSGNKYSSFKMYDTPNGYTLEVAVPWSNIGGFPSNNRNMKVAVLVNQADAGGNRHSIVGSNASNTDVYQYVGNIQNNATFCRTTDLTLSGNNEVMSCMGDLITMTVDGLPAGATPVWQVYDAGTSSWVTDENAKLIDGKWILMADNKKHRVIYNAMKSNVYKLPAATCCSSEVGSYVLWNQDFGTLGSNCARKDFDPSWNVHVSGGMQYNTGAIDDGYYAIVANPGCGEFGNNNGLPWFYDGEDHTAGDTNGGMLLVNNGARESVVFSQYVPSPCDNATVDFSAWFANVCKTQGDCGQPVNLTFKVSGKRDDGVWEDIDISNMSTGDIPWKNSLQWEKKNTSFNTSSYSELYIQVINEGTSGQGNDVAIDDFEFVSCAPVLNLYADVSTYGKTAVACEDKVVTLVPKAPMDLQELYQPLFYMLQRFDPTQNKWVAASGISTPGNNPLPSWDINTADLSFGTHRYRVVMGNNEETVRTVADGGNPTVENCILYTVTDEATIEKSTLDLVADQAITRCEGSSVVLEPENNDSESVSWNWKSGSTVICSGTNDNAAGCDNLQTVVVGSAVSNYTYTATDAYGCTQTTNFTITPSSPKYHFSQDREICEGESAVLKMEFDDAEAPYTFVFSDGTNNENITTSSNPWTRTVTPASTTTYSVRSVRDKNCGMQEDN